MALKCDYCGKEEVLPFKCQYCHGFFCAEHRLPENHTCPEIEKARAPREAPPFEYKITYTPPMQRTKFWFSLTEIKHLIISALLVMGVGLSYMITGFGLSLLESTPVIFAAAAVMFVGLFLLHEIAHKLVAQHYGLWAEFRLILFGALLTLLSVVSPIKFISPGAVMIAGSASKDVVGKTAVAGPLTNLSMALVSFAIARLLESFLWRPLYFVIMLSAAFNAWIALFNVIPFGMLDGLKIFEWNKIVWVAVFIPSLALTIATFIKI